MPPVYKKERHAITDLSVVSYDTHAIAVGLVVPWAVRQKRERVPNAPLVSPHAPYLWFLINTIHR